MNLNRILDVDVTPALQEAARPPKEMRFVAAGLSRMADWRAFLSTLAPAPLSTQPKLLSHSVHGSVALLINDTSLSRSAPTTLARTTIRRIGGAPP
jgi:hypothetical protein